MPGDHWLDADSIFRHTHGDGFLRRFPSVSDASSRLSEAGGSPAWRLTEQLDKELREVFGYFCFFPLGISFTNSDFYEFWGSQQILGL